MSYHEMAAEGCHGSFAAAERSGQYAARDTTGSQQVSAPAIPAGTAPMVLQEGSSVARHYIGSQAPEATHASLYLQGLTSGTRPGRRTSDVVIPSEYNRGRSFTRREPEGRENITPRDDTEVGHRDREEDKVSHRSRQWRTMEEALFALNEETNSFEHYHFRTEVIKVLREFFQLLPAVGSDNEPFLLLPLVRRYADACKAAVEAKGLGIPHWDVHLPTRAQVVGVRMLQARGELPGSMMASLIDCGRPFLADIPSLKYAAVSPVQGYTAKSLDPLRDDFRSLEQQVLGRLAIVEDRLGDLADNYANACISGGVGRAPGDVWKDLVDMERKQQSMETQAGLIEIWLQRIETELKDHERRLIKQDVARD